MATCRASVEPTSEGFELQLTWVDVTRVQAAYEVRQAAMALHFILDQQVLFATEPQPLAALPSVDANGQQVSSYHGATLQSPGWHAKIRMEDPQHDTASRQAFDAIAAQTIY